MNTYFATFISGTGELVREQMQVAKGMTILRMYDGLVIFKYSFSWKELLHIRYFNNVFLLLALQESRRGGKLLLRELMSSVVRKGVRLPGNFREIVHGKKSFKIFSAIENETVSVNRSLLQKIEYKIKRGSGLRLYIPRPDLEFWFMVRREGIGFFGLRLTLVKRENKKRKEGELKTEIVYLMSLVSEPNPQDIVCDPFAGRGALVVERARSFPYREIYTSDTDVSLLQDLRKKVGALKNVHVSRADALHLNLPSSCVDKIITDPPWGEYRKMYDLESFYEGMLCEFNRILRVGGIIVILTSAKEILERALHEKTNLALRIDKRYDVLVSGKKAAIYKIRKTSARHG